MEKKSSKTNQKIAPSGSYHANFHENNKHLYLIYSAKLVPKRAMKHRGLGFGVKKGWEMGARNGD